MSTLTITETVLPNFQLSGPTTLRVYYDRPFIASDSTPVQNGPVGSSEWFVEVVCIVDEDAHTLTIPEYTLITTDNALPAQSPNSYATGVFFSGNTQLDTLFSQFIIPASLAPSTAYSSLAIYNAANPIAYTSASYFTREQVVALISHIFPAPHASTHESGGSDELNVAGLFGLLADPQTPLDHHTRHENGGVDEINVAGLSGLLADAQTPLVHHTSHEAGGTDVVKLDDLGAPDDNTDLNATTGHHGLLPKLSGNSSEFLNGVGAFSTPPDTGITQLTGDVTAGPGNGSQAATLANTAVTPGSYTSANITVDGKGRVTAAANGGGTGAPADATYITQTPNGSLSAEQAMSTLATGLVKNTTGTGVQSIGVAGTDYVAPGAVTTSGLTQATGKILGRQTAGTGAIEELTPTGTGSPVQATSPVFSADITLPNSASPTTSSVAKMAFDTDAWAASRGAVQVNDGTANTFLVGVLASDTPTNGQVPTWNTGGTITWETPSSSGIGGSTGSTDNAVLRADGTGGTTAQASAVTIADTTGTITLPSGAGDKIVLGSSNFGIGTESAENAVTIWAQDSFRFRRGGTTVGGGTEVLRATGGTTSPAAVTDGTVSMNIVGPQLIKMASSTGDKILWQTGSTAYGTGVESDNCVTQWAQDRHRFRIGGSSATSGTETMVLTAKTLAFTAGNAEAFTPTSPSQITADQNNYNPGGQSKFQRWSSDAARNITGLTFSAAQLTGEEHVIVNVGSNNIVLKHQDAGSTAANRFLCSTATDITLSADQAADVIYDGTTQRWRVYKRN